MDDDDNSACAHFWPSTEICLSRCSGVTYFLFLVLDEATLGANNPEAIRLKSSAASVFLNLPQAQAASSIHYASLRDLRGRRVTNRFISVRL